MEVLSLLLPQAKTSSSQVLSCCLCLPPSAVPHRLYELDKLLLVLYDLIRRILHIGLRSTDSHNLHAFEANSVIQFSLEFHQMPALPGFICIASVCESIFCNYISNCNLLIFIPSACCCLLHQRGVRNWHRFNSAMPRFLSSLEKGCSEIGALSVRSSNTFSKRFNASGLLMTIFLKKVLVAKITHLLSRFWSIASFGIRFLSFPHRLPDETSTPDMPGPHTRHLFQSRRGNYRRGTARSPSKHLHICVFPFQQCL